MERRRKIMLIGVVVAVAAGTGHLMQSGRGASPQPSGEAARTVPSVDVSGAAMTAAASAPAAIEPLAAGSEPEALPQTPDADLMPGLIEATALGATEPAEATQTSFEVTPAQAISEVIVETATDITMPQAPSCPIDLVVVSRPGAMLDVAVLAPCAAGERVVLRQDGLVVTGLLSSTGALFATLPAFADPAEVGLLFDDGTRSQSSASVPDLAQFDRFAVQWMDGDAFQIHAYEGGAEFGAPGHVSAAAPGQPGASGGFLTLLGDETVERPLLAEVYTMPAGQRLGTPGLRIALEAAVTEATCGREIMGETLQLGGGTPLLREVTLQMPGCETVGEFLSLENPFRLQTLAQN